MLSTHTAYPGLNPYTSLYNPEGMEKGKHFTSTSPQLHTDSISTWTQPLTD